MTLAAVVLKNAFRSPLRTLLTACGVAVGVVAFVFLRAVAAAWYLGVEAAAADRLVVRNKTSMALALPLAYRERIARVSGVDLVSYGNWFGGIYKDERHFFAQFRVQAQSWLEAYPELLLPEVARHAWLADPAGAIVGEVLAEKYGFKVGDTVRLKGTLSPGDWDLHIRGIYKGREASTDVTTMFMHWKLVDEALPEVERGQVGFYVVVIEDPLLSPLVAAQIDHLFANSAAETHTESERSFQLSFVAMTSSILAAIQVISFGILAIMLLVTANTMAMAVRERVGEHGVMRALGFGPKHIAALVVGESLFVASLGGAAGLLGAKPLVRLFAQAIAARLGGLFQEFPMRPITFVQAAAAALLVGLGAGLIPAYRAGHLVIVEALRKVG